MIWYISVCSMIGGISVSVTTGLGSAIVTTALGDNQVWATRYAAHPALAFLAVLTVADSLSTGSCTFCWFSWP